MMSKQQELFRYSFWSFLWKIKKQRSHSLSFDTMKAFAGMGAAVEVLMKAAPNAFTHVTVSGKEQQGKLRRRKAGMIHRW
ncbi:hypothetical protein ACVXG9_06940 [Escherichia coli]